MVGDTQMKSIMVSGFIPGGNRRRSTGEYLTLGARLRAIDWPKVIFREELDDCWLQDFIMHPKIDPETGTPVGLIRAPMVGNATGDWASDSRYHVIIHQKTEWLQRARQMIDEDVYVWIDYGVFHQQGVTEEIILEFLEKTQHEKGISIPGWYPQGYISDDEPCWRFLGNVVVCHKDFVVPFNEAVKANEKAHLLAGNKLSWEVNTWARVEGEGVLPIRQYPASFDQTMFTNYA